LLADRTREHQEFFKESKEAEFFSCQEEFLDKVRFYTNNESTRARLAAAGYDRCVEGRYAYVYRLAAVLGHLVKT
jgi:spore maturation protein CgeB